jgi:hypothetical protein
VRAHHARRCGCTHTLPSGRCSDCSESTLHGFKSYVALVGHTVRYAYVTSSCGPSARERVELNVLDFEPLEVRVRKRVRAELVVQLPQR